MGISENKKRMSGYQSYQQVPNNVSDDDEIEDFGDVDMIKENSENNSNNINVDETKSGKGTYQSFNNNKKDTQSFREYYISSQSAIDMTQGNMATKMRQILVYAFLVTNLLSMISSIGV